LKTKSTDARAIRRVVTGLDARGCSIVIKDGPAPNDHKNLGISRYFTDLWVWNECPAPLAGNGDDGDGRYDFPCPPDGGHLRIVEWPHRPPAFDPANDPEHVPEHAPKIRPPGRTWDRGGNGAYSSAIHKTESVDYGIVLAGERILLLKDRELVMQPGDTIIQLAAWHQWKWTRPDSHGLMLFDFIAARWDNIRPSTPPQPAPALPLPEGVKAARRIVIMDGAPGEPDYVLDAPSHDIRTDPARPGYAATRMWVTDSTPAKLEFETLHLPHALEAPVGGSVLRIVTLPPDDSWKSRVGRNEVRTYFESMGSPAACAWSENAPHPYMQNTGNLDFCIVLEGEIVLVLDTTEVALKAGDVVIERGTRHAWSNRTRKPAVVAIASHSAKPRD